MAARAPSPPRTTSVPSTRSATLAPVARSTAPAGTVSVAPARMITPCSVQLPGEAGSVRFSVTSPASTPGSGTGSGNGSPDTVQVPSASTLSSTGYTVAGARLQSTRWSCTRRQASAGSAVDQRLCVMFRDGIVTAGEQALLSDGMRTSFGSSGDSNELPSTTSRRAGDIASAAPTLELELQSTKRLPRTSKAVFPLLVEDTSLTASCTPLHDSSTLPSTATCPTLC